MRFVTCIVRENQLRLYGHVARFPDADPAHKILSAREPRECRRPMGRPRASWLQQVDHHLKEREMGQASAGGMARQRLLEYWRKVDAATRCLAHAPIPELMPSVRICSNQITLPDQMQPSGTAKHVLAMKRIAGEQRPGSTQEQAMLDQWKKTLKQAGNISQQCIYLQPSKEKYVAQ